MGLSKLSACEQDCKPIHQNGWVLRLEIDIPRPIVPEERSQQLSHYITVFTCFSHSRISTISQVSSALKLSRLLLINLDIFAGSLFDDLVRLVEASRHTQEASRYYPLVLCHPISRTPQREVPNRHLIGRCQAARTRSEKSLDHREARPGDDLLQLFGCRSRGWEWKGRCFWAGHEARKEDEL